MIKIIGIIAGIIAIGIILVSVLLARYVARPKVITKEKEIEYEQKYDKWRDYPRMPQEEYRIKSWDGYELHATYIPAKEDSNRYVILSHGYRGCRLGSVKYLHMFRDFGFHCIVYDNRGHGDNQPCPCTMGAKESRDLFYIIKDAYARYGDDIYLGLHGESMGAGLQLNALQYQLPVKFIVNDCGYNDLRKLLSGMLKKYIHLPKWFIYPASLASKICYGYFFSEVMPIEHLKNNTIPICFMHGADDDFIEPVHSREMYEANSGYSELHLMPGAGHARSVIVDEAEYRRIVKMFLETIREQELLRKQEK